LLDVSMHLVVTITLVALGTLFAQRMALDLRMWRATLATWLFVGPTAALPDHAWILGGLGVLAGFAATAWIGFHSESTRSSAR
jgi:hypothetical protein